MRAIYILWLRQLKRYLRSRARVFSSLAQPMLFLLAMGFGFGPIYAKAGGGDYMQFLAPGIIAMSVMTSAVLSGIDLIWDKQFGFLKETMVAPVSRVNILIGRCLGGASVAFLQGLFVFMITLVVGFRPHSLLFVPVAFFYIALISIFFTLMGTAIASVLSDMHAFPMVMNLLVMPLFFISGAIFPFHNFPPLVRGISYADPLTYGVDGLRWALSGISVIGPSLSALVLFGFISVTLMIATGLFKRIEA